MNDNSKICDDESLIICAHTANFKNCGTLLYHPFPDNLDFCQIIKILLF